jgi:hypothetical protein
MIRSKGAPMRRLALALLVAVPVLAAGGVVLVSDSPAESETTRTLTLKELERGATFTHVRNTRGAPRRSNLAGDQIVFTYPLADLSGGVVGKLHADCTTTTGAPHFPRSVITCAAVAVMRNGTLTLQASVALSGSVTTGAVTGGTGAYANARGTFTSRPVRGGALDTFTLVG